MAEGSPVMLPPAAESIEGATNTALEPEPGSGKPPEPTSEPGFVCDCKEWMHSACEGLPFYKEHECQRYCVLHYPGNEKSADFKMVLDRKLNRKDFDFRGVWFPDPVYFSRFRFSADSDFRSATFNAAAYFSYATFSADANFSSVTFGADVDFSSATFCAAGYFSSATFNSVAYFTYLTVSAAADFSYATFRAAVNFSHATFRAAAYFSYATFSANADLSSTSFSGASYFSSATFRAEVSFSSASFSASDFGSATFSASANFSSVTFSADADFRSATFTADAGFDLSVFHARTDFSHASFNDSTHFLGRASERLLEDGTSLAAMALGKDPSLDFQHVRIEHPERIAFHTLNLRPHWFVNVDSRQFVFTDVGWVSRRIAIKQEIATLEDKGVSSPNRLLAITCRHLAENAEGNNRYEEASNFRYWAMDLARRTKWKGWTLWKTDWLHMLYWLVSGYGERILRALGVLAALWIVFVLLYTRVGFTQQLPKASNEGPSSATGAPMTIEDRMGQPLEFSRALTYSLAVMSLQKPEPRPLTNWAQALVTLETILGPVQAALLALAIRRKFMR